jgi:quercetin dioxygenase-like cupin family protein
MDRERIPRKETMIPREGHIKAGAAEWEVVAEGVRRKILGYDPHLMMVHVEFAKGSIGYVHRHPHRQVTFVERGSFEVQVGERKSTLSAGDCFFIPPEIDHGVVALEDGSLVDVFTPAREDFLAPGS